MERGLGTKGAEEGRLIMQMADTERDQLDFEGKGKETEAYKITALESRGCRGKRRILEAACICVGKIGLSGLRLAQMET